MLYADSESNADQLYFGDVFVPDPFISFGHKGKRYAVINALEFSRVAKESKFDVVLSYEEYKDRAKKKYRKSEVGVVEIIRLIAAEFKIKKFDIAENFPAGLALKLIKANVGINVLDGSLFSEREIKTEDEINFLKEGNKISAFGIRKAEEVLRAAKIKKNKLYYQNKILTSEFLQNKISIACFEAGGLASNPIVAGGDQACDPHCFGSGPLRPNELIIVDVFPRVLKTGYFGDMTRTFLKGKANDAQRRLVSAVRDSQKKAISVIKARVKGDTVHKAANDVFTQRGYKTQKTENGYKGFFHSTGHGLGLDIHESPRLSLNGSMLKKNMVVTVEPGLYYPGLGGCRIEDVVQVTNTGCEMLLKFHYKWELP